MIRSIITKVCIGIIAAASCGYGMWLWYYQHNNARIQELCNTMPLKEKIGQLIMAGLHVPAIHESLASLITDIKPGGFIFFQGALVSKDQLHSLVFSLQQCAQANDMVPFFMAVDQEGGKVNRIKLGLTHIPGNMALSAAGSEQYAYAAGTINGMELHMLGINLNLAPCVDVLRIPENEVIGTRSFGSESMSVSNYACAYFDGMRQYHVLGCAKHFPNHGMVQEDSHRVLPWGMSSRDEMVREALPYKKLIYKKIDMIMPAHIYWRSVDQEPIPGTVSNNIINGILRNDMGYKGIVISDDMSMKAIANQYSYGDAAVRFVKAGGDIILIGNSNRKALEHIVESLLQAVQKGIISENRINMSLQRILRCKMKIFPQLLWHNAMISPESITWEANRIQAYDIARRSLKKYGNWGNLPVFTDQTNMLVVSSSKNWEKIVKAYSNHIDFFAIPRYPLPKHHSIIRNLRLIVQRKQYRMICFVSENRKQSQWYQNILSDLSIAFPKVIIFSEDLSCVQNSFFQQFPLILSWGPSELSRRAILDEIMLVK